MTTIGLESDTIMLISMILQDFTYCKTIHFCVCVCFLVTWYANCLDNSHAFAHYLYYTCFSILAILTKICFDPYLILTSVVTYYFPQEPLLWLELLSIGNYNTTSYSCFKSWLEGLNLIMKSDSLINYYLEYESITTFFFLSRS